MTTILYEIVYLISKIHTYLLKLNDTYELYFTDKQLHFFVIGILGLILMLVIYPIFKSLAEGEHYLTLTGIYAFTLILVITFAIEIGQKITNTGNMEFEDILFGVGGFFAMYLTLALIFGFFKFVIWLVKEKM